MSIPTPQSTLANCVSTNIPNFKFTIDIDKLYHNLREGISDVNKELRNKVKKINKNIRKNKNIVTISKIISDVNEVCLTASLSIDDVFLKVNDDIRDEFYKVNDANDVNETTLAVKNATALCEFAIIAAQNISTVMSEDIDRYLDSYK